MAAPAKRNAALFYAAVAAFLIFAIIKIRQQRQYTPQVKDTVVDTTGGSWSLGAEQLEPLEEQAPSHAGSLKSVPDIHENLIAFGHDSSPEVDDVFFVDDSAPRAVQDPMEEEEEQPSFYEIAIETGTDKVTLHTYQAMYERYHTWTEYFPSLEIFFIKTDMDCASKLAHELTDATIVKGDPGDETFLAGFLREHNKKFDVIVISGGHTVEQQMASMRTLWKAVNPGGVLFCEYLETSYMENYGGKGKVRTTTTGKSMVQFLQEISQDMMYPDPNLGIYQLKGMGATWERQIRFDEVESIDHIDCGKQICAISKRAD